MPDESIDKRLRDVENKVYSFEQSFGRIADDIHDIKTNIQEFIEVKSKLGAIDVLFKRIDELRKEIQAVDKATTPMALDHAQCMKKREALDIIISTQGGRITALETETKNNTKLKDNTISFLSGRFGSVIDTLLKVGGGALIFYLAKHAA